MSRKMMENSKKHEKLDNYTIMKKFGFYRPSTEDRKIIRKAFKKIGKTIHGIGYDLIDDKTRKDIDQNRLNINDTTLYELKTHNIDSKSSINDDFTKFSYGVSVNEIKNGQELGNKFKLILLNAKTGKIVIKPFNELPITGIIGFQCVEGKKGIKINQILESIKIMDK